MAGFVELTDGFEFEETFEGSTGTRVFVEKASGGVTLPVLGDTFDASNPRLVANTIQSRQFGSTATIKIFTVSYATTPPETEVIFSDLPRSLDVSAELLNIGKADSGTLQEYESDNAKIDQDLYKRVVTVTINLTRIYSNFEELLKKLKETSGKVNSKVFLGQPVRSILFNGAHADELTDDSGFRKWNAELTFEQRAPDKDGAGDFGNWDSIWREKAAKWDDVTPAIYDGADFENILF